MQEQIRTRELLAAACLALLPFTGSVAASDEPLPVTPKGIYHAVDQYQQTGIKFHVDLEEGQKRRRVPTAYDFHSGDRFTFSFEVNRDSYIYVINRTIRKQSEMVAAGLQSKRIYRVRESPPAPPPAPAASSGGAHRPTTSTRPPVFVLGEPRLLFPTYEAGSNNRLRGNVGYLVPARGHYVMDEIAGTERLYVIISDHPVDLGKYFKRKDGGIRSSGRIPQLHSKLMERRQNADVDIVPLGGMRGGNTSPHGSANGEIVSKGIVHEVESYGVSVDPSMPAVVEIDLRHWQ